MMHHHDAWVQYSVPSLPAPRESSPGVRCLFPPMSGVYVFPTVVHPTTPSVVCNSLVQDGLLSAQASAHTCAVLVTIFLQIFFPDAMAVRLDVYLLKVSWSIDVFSQRVVHLSGVYSNKRGIRFRDELG